MNKTNVPTIINNTICNNDNENYEYAIINIAFDSYAKAYKFININDDLMDYIRDIIDNYSKYVSNDILRYILRKRICELQMLDMLVF